MTQAFRMLLMASLLVLAGCGPPPAQLNVYIWSEYLDPEIVAAFERQHQCRVSIDLYEDPESMMAKLAAGGDSLYDVVVPSNTTLPALVKRGLLAPLRRESIPNLAHIQPEFANPSFDPGNRYGAPFLWGTTGLYLRAPADATLPESWSFLFDPAASPGKFLLLDDPRSCIGAALKFSGASLNSGQPAELAAAREKLIEAKARALGFEASVAARNRVLSKEASAAMVYSVEAVRGMDEDPETRYVIPREGGEIWLDCLSIPAKAPHPALAEKFIDFLLSPEIAARSAIRNRAGTPNAAALKFLSPKDLANSAIYPPPEVRARLEYAYDLGETNRLYDELWTQIKAR